MSAYRRKICAGVPNYGVTVLSLFLCGCSLAIDTSQTQCTVDTDCQQGPSAGMGSTCVVGLCEVEERWQCLIETGAPPSSNSENETIGMQLEITSLNPDGSKASIPDSVDISLCHIQDPLCVAPYQAELTPQGLWLDFDVPIDFNGYLQLQAPDRVSTLYFLHPPHEPSRALPPVQLLSQSLLGAWMSNLDVDRQAQSGMLKLFAQDCSGDSVAGVSYQLSGGNSGDANPFYEVAGVPSLRAESTDSSGHGGFVNLATGLGSASAAIDSSTASLEETGFLIREASISYARIGPAMPNFEGSVGTTKNTTHDREFQYGQ